MVNFWKKTKVDPRVAEVLISGRQIKKGIKQAANWINTTYKDQKPVVIGVLKGCIPFIGQITPLLTFDFEMEFMSASSFKGATERQKELEISLDLKTDVKDRDVLILEDIIDTARTLTLIVKLLKQRGAKSIKIVTLLDKPECRKEDLHADYSCFVIPNIFIVGFGLDYKEVMRNFNYIGRLKESFLESEKKGCK